MRAPAVIRSLSLVLAMSLAVPSDTFGLTWGTTVKLTTSRTAAAWVGLASTGASAAHSAYQEATRGGLSVFYRRSSDKGATWAAPVRISPASAWVADAAAIAVAGTRIDIAWRQEDASSDPNVTTNSIRYRGSNTDGVTWLAPKTLATGSYALGIPAITHDPGGRVVVAWTDGSSIRVRRSTDHGASWAAVQSVGSTGHTPYGGSGSIEGYPAVATTAGVTYVVWYKTATSIVVRRSTDGGVTWSGETTLSTAAAGGPPTIGAAGSSAVIAYEESSATSIWVATRRTSTSGSSWSSRVALTSTSSTTFAFGPVVRYTGGAWRVVYEKCTAAACAGSKVWYQHSTNGGATWTTAEQASNSIREYATPNGVAFPGRVLIMYHDWDPDTFDSDVYVRPGT